MENRKINAKGLNLIKQFEGLALKAYKCPANVWTIGYGHTAKVKENDICTEEQAEQFLLDDLENTYQCIYNMVKRPINDNQFSALCCFIYNVGCNNYRLSRMKILIDAGEFKKAANEFGKWINAKGKILPGLVSRRREERKLFLAGV
jgi:lysozyme